MSERITKSDLEKRIERLNKKYDKEFYLQSQGSPTQYAVTTSDEHKIVFRWGDNREIFYLINGMLEAPRYGMKQSDDSDTEAELNESDDPDPEEPGNIWSDNDGNS